MKEINVNIFVYSIGLAILLTGVNILTEFISKEIKISVGIIFVLFGLLLLVIALTIKGGVKERLEKKEG